jgi:uncharacterized protein YjiS (DUF1127 family)
MEMKMREYALHHAQQTEQVSGQGVLIQLWKNWKAKREVRKLLTLDDLLLRDIGVRKHDLDRAMRLPLQSNAFAFLQQARQFSNF